MSKSVIQINGQQVDLLTPGEVAQLFRVDAKTVTRWAKDKKLTFIWTLGGHRRYPAAQFAASLTPVPAQQANGQAGGE